MDSHICETLLGLKKELQNIVTAQNFEKLIAAQLSKIINVPISVAKSGYQYGADAGTSGLQGRHLRIECKKYGDSSSLKERELLGEIDQAIARDPALEAWILVTTLQVPEQLMQTLNQKGEREGVPVLVLDWAEDIIGPLAAVCAFDPSTVDEFSKKAGNFARRIQSDAASKIESLKRTMQSWCIGYDSLRVISHTRLQNIWDSPRISNAKLGQNVAGGDQKNKIRRTRISLSLDSWWNNSNRSNAPAAVIGLDGTGKTWAVIDWLVENLEEKPIVLVMPSSSIANKPCGNVVDVKRLIADHILSVAGVRNSNHWFNRLELLLKRPIDEGPVFVFFLDGLNQEPSANWLSLMKTLQDAEFSGRIRVILSSRPHHYSQKLHDLNGLIDRPQEIEVVKYDQSEGGELDQMLAFEGLKQSDLPGDLLDLARVPRLFKLVIKLREKFDINDTITVHQLLWEYGIDSFRDRAGRSFSAHEWLEWIREIARRYLDGVHQFSLKDLSDSVHRSDLNPDEVSLRLSEIVDGGFVQRIKNGKHVLDSSLINHSLGLALLSHLESGVFDESDTVEYELQKWLDPITGIDESTEILRAAVSICLAQEDYASELSLGVLVTTWLHSQNISDDHRLEIKGLAPRMPDALLDTIQNSTDYAKNSALAWATNALCGVSKTNQYVLDSIVQRTGEWIRGVTRMANADGDRRKYISTRLKKRVGRDESCILSVAGVELEIRDEYPQELQDVVPKLMEGYPLLPFLGVLETAAIALTVGHRDEYWKGIKWRCLLNELDPLELADNLRCLADDVSRRSAELGVHPDLPKRAASHLLCLTGKSVDEDKAVFLKPTMDDQWDYEKDYLVNPGKSFFALERRHASCVLSDISINLYSRVQKTRELWCDPTFVPPNSFVTELREALSNFDVNALKCSRSTTSEDIWFEELEPVFARCIPQELSEVIRKKMRWCTKPTPDQAYWKANFSTTHFILATEEEIESVRVSRYHGISFNQDNESCGLNQLLILEIRDLNAIDQHRVIIEANLGAIYREIESIAACPSSADVDDLIQQFSISSSKEQKDLLTLLTIHSLELSDYAWDWIASFLNSEDHKIISLAIQTLYHSNSERLGMLLFQMDWDWTAHPDQYIRHIGSGALAHCPKGIGFEQLVSKIAPWRLLEAVRIRGSDPEELQSVLPIINNCMMENSDLNPDLGSGIIIDREYEKHSPYSFSINQRYKSDDLSDRLEYMAMGIDEREELRQRAVGVAVERVQNLQRSGACFYHSPIDKDDFDLVIQHYIGNVYLWIDGLDEMTVDFRKRVRLAESFFLALCEALLDHIPERGVQLWNALREVLHTRYIGLADVDSLVHMVFSAADSKPVAKLREQLLDLQLTNTDMDLFQIAIASCHHSQFAWLSNQIEQDRSSQFAWRKKRAIVLEGYALGENELPIDGAWPEGNFQTSYAVLNRDSSRSIWSNACAKHWWKIFIDTCDPVEAYAAWVLFLRSADSRAWVWMNSMLPADAVNNTFMQMKLAFAEINKHKIKSSMNKRTKEFDRHFLGRKTVVGIHPWTT